VALRIRGSGIRSRRAGGFLERESHISSDLGSGSGCEFEIPFPVPGRRSQHAQGEWPICSTTPSVDRPLAVEGKRPAEPI